MTKPPGGPQKCRLILNQSLAIQLSRPGNVPDDFWMYDSGYTVFQNFLAANAQCWWNSSLIHATRALKYAGHVAPGMLLVTAEPCALEILRSAYARSVLKPPATYSITFVGDIEDCILTPTVQGQFTPLPEALCDVIMDLTSQGHSATIENIRCKLTTRFSHMQTPSTEMIYDSLAQLNQERKIYQTSKGYFIVTPERRRSRSSPREAYSLSGSFDEDHLPKESRTVLLSNSEALHNLYGEISTERDGDLTHQCIQTNLADVISGGNPNDKIMYARCAKRRSSSFPTRSLERRHSLRLFGSSKRLQRCTSTRSLSKNYTLTVVTPDSSSSEYQSTDSSSPKRPSLLSRIFRRSGRQKNRQVETYSAQFPPTEWFNRSAIHLHNIGTQTSDQDLLSSSTFYDGSEISQSSTLPRRHRRHMSSESTFMIWSRDCSPIRRRSPHYSSGSLPRSVHSANSCNQSKKMKAKLNGVESGGAGDKRPPSQQSQYHRHNSRLEEKINSERERHFRMIQSGPSSLESGKTSLLSGPSSIDSGKNSSRTTSCLSSLDSSTNSTTPSIRSSMKVSPNQRDSLKIKDDYQSVSLTNSMSNNSITLQVTTSSPNHNPAVPLSSNSSSSSSSSSNCSNSTKIYVKNSPVRSVIKLENGKLTENSNVFIINKNETISGNNHKEVIQLNSIKGARQQPLETQFDHINGDCVVVLRDHSPAPAQVTPICNFKNANNGPQVEPILTDSLINNKHLLCPILNNSEPETTLESTSLASSNPDHLSSLRMNNNRKMSLQTNQSGTNLIYKNQLKSGDLSQPLNKSKNFAFDVIDDNSTEQANNTKLNNQIGGSVGNLAPIFDYKPINQNPITYKKSCSHNLLTDPRQSQQVQEQILSKLNSVNSIDSLANLLQKNTNLITAGSEPNLVGLKNDKAINKNDKSNILKKETNLTKSELDPSAASPEEIYDFPSLTDLSFNSLAALKILQELSQEKNKNITSCTDYGLV